MGDYKPGFKTRFLPSRIALVWFCRSRRNSLSADSLRVMLASYSLKIGGL
jgi:hypothetical protein